MSSPDIPGQPVATAPADALQEGLRAMIPMLAGAIPFGMTTGMASISVGLTPTQAMGMSALVFAGSSQLAALQLIADGALPLVIVFTAWVINLRFSMYSASLAPHLPGLPWRWKLPLSYLMTDQSYALTVLRAQLHPERGALRWYYLGGAVVMWLVWLSACVIGIYVGALVPPNWPLEFIVPLIFIGMLVPAMQDRPTVLAGVVGGAVAVVAHPLPMNLGLMTGAIAGVIAGILADRRSRRRPA